MATDVDRLRIIYELDDLPAAKAFRRLREEAERTNAAIKGGATGAERQVVDSAKRGADEVVQAERAKADAAEAAARKQADAAREAAREQSEAARAAATALKAAEKEKAEAAKKAAAEAKAAATALAAAEKQATAEAKEAAKRAAAETAEASRRATAQAKAAAAERAAADKAAAEVSKKAAKDKAAAEMAATEAADRAVSAGIYRQRMIGMQLSQVGQQAAATGNLAQALAIQLPDLALLAGGAGMAMAGAGAALAISLAPALLDAVGKTKSLSERMKDLETSTDDMVSAAERAARPIYELRDAFGDLADYIADADRAAAMFARIRAEADLQGAAKMVGKGYRAGDDLDARGWLIGDQITLPPTVEEERLARLDRLRGAFGATKEQAESLMQAINRLNTTNGPEAATRDAANLQVILAGVMENAKLSEDQIERIKDLAAEAGVVRVTAEKQVAAATAETQRVLDRYAGTTRQLEELARERGISEKALDEARAKGDKARIAQLEEVVLNIDVQIDKTRELGRVSDEVFAQMAKRINEVLGAQASSGFSALGQKLANLGAPYAGEMVTAKDDIEASKSGILALIKRRESGGDYNAQWGGGKYSGGAKNFVNMTVREVLAVQREMLRHPDNTANSSAVGAYQIVGTTLGGKNMDGSGGLVAKLNISLDELFTPQLQDRLGNQLLREIKPGDIGRLKKTWTSLQGAGDSVIQQAWGQQSIPRIDPEVEKAREKAQSDRQREIERETQERKRQLEQVQQYGEQLAANLLTTQQTAQLEQERAEAIARINASGMSEADKAAAIAEVNAEMQRQIAVMALMEEAKRRQVDLDARMVGSTMTYREAILGIADAEKTRALSAQQSQAAADKLKDSQEFAAQQTQALKDGLVDAIVEGENFSDVLSNVAKSLAKAALQAALFGEGPMAQGGGGLLGGLFGGGGGLFSSLFGGGGGAVKLAGARAAGGPVSAGAPYLVGERGPEIIVPRAPGQVIPNNALRGGAAPTITFAPTIQANGAVSQTDLDMAKRQMAQFMDDQFIPALRKHMPNFNARYA